MVSGVAPWLIRLDADWAQSAGVSDFSVSLETQEVLVTGTIPYDDLLAKLKKTGKEVSHAIILVAGACLSLLGSLWRDSRMSALTLLMEYCGFYVPTECRINIWQLGSGSPVIHGVEYIKYKARLQAGMLLRSMP